MKLSCPITKGRSRDRKGGFENPKPREKCVGREDAERFSLAGPGKLGALGC